MSPTKTWSVWGKKGWYTTSLLHECCKITCIPIWADQERVKYVPGTSILQKNSPSFSCCSALSLPLENLYFLCNLLCIHSRSNKAQWWQLCGSSIFHVMFLCFENINSFIGTIFLQPFLGWFHSHRPPLQGRQLLELGHSQLQVSVASGPKPADSPAHLMSYIPFQSSTSSAMFLSLAALQGTYCLCCSNGLPWPAWWKGCQLPASMLQPCPGISFWVGFWF